MFVVKGAAARRVEGDPGLFSLSARRSIRSSVQIRAGARQSYPVIAMAVEADPKLDVQLAGIQRDVR